MRSEKTAKEFAEFINSRCDDWNSEDAEEFAAFLGVELAPEEESPALPEVIRRFERMRRELEFEATRPDKGPGLLGRLLVIARGEDQQPDEPRLRHRPAGTENLAEMIESDRAREVEEKFQRYSAERDEAIQGEEAKNRLVSELLKVIERERDRERIEEYARKVSSIGGGTRPVEIRFGLTTEAFDQSRKE